MHSCINRCLTDALTVHTSIARIDCRIDHHIDRRHSIVECIDCRPHSRIDRTVAQRSPHLSHSGIYRCVYRTLIASIAALNASTGQLHRPLHRSHQPPHRPFSSITRGPHIEQHKKPPWRKKIQFRVDMGLLERKAGVDAGQTYRTTQHAMHLSLVKVDCTPNFTAIKKQQN